MNDLVHTLLNSDYGSSPNGPETVLFVVLLSFVIGQFIGWVYMWTHRSLSYSQTFVASLAVVPVIVALMMLLMAGSIVFAFGLLAVFAVVRFRNVLKDTRDTTFIMWAILEGLGVGTQKFSTALVASLGVAIVFLYLSITAFGSRLRHDAVLSVQLTGDPGAGTATLRRILRRYSSREQLASERELSEAGLQLSYRLLLRDPARVDELRRDLAQAAGIDRVLLYLREDEAEI
jgi:Domain of unknown function (DUF4956)